MWEILRGEERKVVGRVGRLESEGELFSRDYIIGTAVRFLLAPPECRKITETRH